MQDRNKDQKPRSDQLIKNQKKQEGREVMPLSESAERLRQAECAVRHQGEYVNGQCLK